MHFVCIQWEEIGPDDSRFQLKSHVPTNIKLHIAWKIIHKIRTSNYGRQAGHAQVPFDPSKELVRSESAERKNGERGNPNYCLLGFCLPLSSLVIDVFGLDTIHTDKQQLFHNTFSTSKCCMHSAQLACLSASNLIIAPLLSAKQSMPRLLLCQKKQNYLFSSCPRQPLSTGLGSL